MSQSQQTLAAAPPWPGFWKGKQPCWVVVACPPLIAADCVAHQHPERPCWEQEGTQCEKVLGLGRNCAQCAVFERYHAA